MFAKAPKFAFVDPETSDSSKIQLHSATTHAAIELCKDDYQHNWLILWNISIGTCPSFL